MDIGLEELSPERIGTFDLVLFMGVFYHLPDPLPILERVASVASERLILETHADLLWLRRPAMVFYPGTSCERRLELVGPQSALLVEALLRANGFAKLEVVYRESLPYRLARSVYSRLRGEHLLTQQGRLVVHATR